MGEISEKAGIGVSLSQTLGDQEVTVHFERVALEAGLKAILRSAGTVNHAVLYHPSRERGKVGQWVVEKL